MNRSTTITAVRTMLQIPDPDNEIFDSEISDVLVDNAIREFQRHRPRILRTDYLGNGQYTAHLPSTWEMGFSVIRGIYVDDDFSPIDQNEYFIERADETQRALNSASSGATSVTLTTAAQAAFFRDGDAIEIKNATAASGQLNWVRGNGNASTGAVTLLSALSSSFSTNPRIRKRPRVRFSNFLPSASQFFSIESTAPHVHSETEDTIESSQYGTFVTLCAALVAEAIAAKFSRSVDSALDADSVDFGALSEQWVNRAKGLREVFEKQIGIGGSDGEAKVRAGSAIRDLDQRLSLGGRFLFHGGSRR